jgi:hypothetical protein
MLAGSAMAITRSRSVFVSDLSSHGARLGGRDLPHSGDEVLMIVGPVDAMATVVWQNADKCGVRFEEPLGESSIAQMKRDAAWAAVTGWAP